MIKPYRCLRRSGCAALAEIRNGRAPHEGIRASARKVRSLRTAKRSERCWKELVEVRSTGTQPDRTGGGVRDDAIHAHLSRVRAFEITRPSSRVPMSWCFRYSTGPQAASWADSSGKPGAIDYQSDDGCSGRGFVYERFQMTLDV